MKFFQKIIIVILLSVVILLPFVFSKYMMESIEIKESLVSDTKQDKIPEPVRLMITPIKKSINDSFGADGRLKKDAILPFKKVINDSFGADGKLIKDAILPFKKVINDYLDNAQNNMTKKQFKDMLSSVAVISREINDSIKY